MNKKLKYLLLLVWILPIFFGFKLVTTIPFDSYSFGFVLFFDSPNLIYHLGAVSIFLVLAIVVTVFIFKGKGLKTQKKI